MAAANLDSIPFDVLHQIASGLSCQDFISLSRVNRQLNSTLRDETIARRSVESYITYTREASLARHKKISYREAIGRTYDIREAFSTAEPYSVSVVALGNSFVYNEGILCYVHNDLIRVLNVHGVGKNENVFDIGEALRGGRYSYAPGTDGPIHLSLLYYSNTVLACLCEIEGHPGAWLFALDVTGTDPSRSPILLFSHIRDTNNLFVRHNGRYLYYGTLSVRTPEGHLEWLLHGVDLRTGYPIDTAIHLKHFVGSEIGQSVCFEIHKGHLYAVSTQTSAVAEEVDWTSYYCCLRIPLHNGKKTPIKRIWRRQHREGPINDSWTDLSLHRDTETGGLVIMECRREWQNGGSENFRTYYTQPVDCFDDNGENNFPFKGPVQLPQNDLLTSTLGPNDKPNYEPPKKRIRRHYHPEYSEEDKCSDRRDFILAKTKYHTYNPSASTFLDIVSDPPPQSTLAVPPDRLRLRIGSRKRKSPIDENGDEGENGLLYPPEHHKEGTEDCPLEKSDERFVSRGIRLWPPANAPPDLHHILCPSAKAGRIDAISDERTLIYSTQPKSPGAPRPIILVNFDPRIRFKGLKRLSSQSIRAEENNSPVEIDTLKPSECYYRPQARPVGLQVRPVSKYPQESPILPPTHPDAKKVKYVWLCFYVAKAMYSEINWGYWLR